MSEPVVVVTGATGYIASHIVKVLLEQGYTVRATVRDPSNTRKCQFLRDMPGAADRLHFFKANLLTPGDFDEVVQGATHVVHTASPVPLEVVDDPYEAVVAPAVEGTRNVFEAIHKSDTVRRVILTSSIRAVFGFGCEKPPDYLYTEDDWNQTSTLANNQAYSLSKTLAEQVAWDYANGQSRYTMCTLLPGLVFGPTLSGNEDSMSITLFKDLVTGQPLVHLAWGITDVRDVAKAHAAAVRNDAAVGRYICTSETFSFLEIVNTVRHKVKRSLGTSHLPMLILWIGHYIGYTRKMLPYEDIAYNVGYPLRFDNTKIKRDLMPDGFIPSSKTFCEMYDNLKEVGIIPADN